ncbi:MAG: sugar phosphate isomerase/epimerase family protein [Planctomycetota bacterium]
MYASLMPDLIGIGSLPAESVRVASRAGFGGLDIRLNRFADEVERIGVDALADAMQAANLRPGYCSVTPQKIAVDQAEWDGEISDLDRRCALARELGYQRATSVMLPFHAELDFESNTRLHVDRVRQAADVLAEFGMSFGLEYVSPETRRRGQRYPFVHTLEQSLELLDRIDRGNVGLMLDCFHWHCADESPDAIAALPAERIVAVHVCDLIPGRQVTEQVVTERGLPGEFSIVDITGFLSAIAQTGYDGPITAEPTNPRWAAEDQETAAKLTVDAICDCLERAGVTLKSES